MKPFAALVLLALAAAPESGALLAQDATLQFEVASVRPSGPLPPGARGGRGGLVPNSPDRLTYERVLFRTLLMDAYGVRRDQIKGPGWATSDAVDGGALFDVSAKVPPGATKAQVGDDAAEPAEGALPVIASPRVSRVIRLCAGGRQGWVEAQGKRGASGRNRTERDRSKGQSISRLEGRLSGVVSWAQYGRDVQRRQVRIRFRDYPLSDLVQQFSLPWPPT